LFEQKTGDNKMKTLLIILFATALTGSVYGQADSSKYTKYIVLADSVAKKMLTEFNKSDEAKKLGGPFLFEDYSEKLSIDTVRNRQVLTVDYEYKKPVGFLGHPQHFGVWVYLDNCETKLFGGE